MNELQAIVAAASEARRQGRPALLATVVRVRGSAYRRPGARMLVTEDGWQAGSISGGCLEQDIARRAWWHTRTGAPAVVTYDSTLADEDDALSWGFGLGCGGVVDVLLERIGPRSPACPIVFVEESLRRRRSGILATVIDIAVTSGSTDYGVAVGDRLLWHIGEISPAAVTWANGDLTARVAKDAARMAGESGSYAIRRYGLADGPEVDILLERIAPPTPLLICGAGHDAAPLAAMAKLLGWHVTVVEPRLGARPQADRFPGADAVIACPPADIPNRVTIDRETMAVVMTHNVALDAEVLAALLPSPAGYIGVLGPRHRTEILLSLLGERGVAVAESDHRLHAPVGLDIGAGDPQTIALSILAEMQATVAGRSGGSLRDRELPIQGDFREMAPSERKVAACHWTNAASAR